MISNINKDEGVILYFSKPSVQLTDFVSSNATQSTLTIRAYHNRLKKFANDPFESKYSNLLIIPWQKKPVWMTQVVMVGDVRFHFDKFIVQIGSLDTDQQRTRFKKK